MWEALSQRRLLQRGSIFGAFCIPWRRNHKDIAAGTAPPTFKRLRSRIATLRMTPSAQNVGAPRLLAAEKDRLIGVDIDPVGSARIHFTTLNLWDRVAVD